MVNLEFFPPLEWVGHGLPEVNRRYFKIAVVGHPFYPEGLRLWSYGTGLPFFCLFGETSGGLKDRMEELWYTRFGYTRIIGGGWKK